MTQITMAERAKLFALIGRRALRSTLAFINTHPLLRWRFGSGKTDRLVIAPQDLRTADATRAAEIYAGQFAFAGKLVLCDRRSPFEVTPPSHEWAAMLVSFSWLRHLRAADSNVTRANARTLIEDWINRQGSWHSIGWRHDILSRRLICWLSHAPFILQDADGRFYHRFLRSVSRQVHYLRRTLNESPEGFLRLQALMALTYAGLCVESLSGGLHANVRRLMEELRRQILPDGGHISRNPGVLIEILADLLPLRQLFTARSLQPPQTLNNAIDRMMPMLRFFRHGDGNFALFNGMGVTPVDLLATVLAYDDTRGMPLSNASHSGYQRVDAGETTLLMDTGCPPPVALSQEAHAGCLSFELSWRMQRLVVNCGLPNINKNAWRQVARQTAAHSTATLAGKSSCHFVESTSFKRLLFGMPIVAGPRVVQVEHERHPENIVLATSHDGYADDLDWRHKRWLRLSSDGRLLDGKDSFTPVNNRVASTKISDDFAIRFHLHPSIKVSRLPDGRSLTLLLPDHETWTFATTAEVAELEESVFLAGKDSPRRTTQIVIYGRARSQSFIQWNFRHGSLNAKQGGFPELVDEPTLF
jgi:uncharacterized heparinase superfamily protein